MTTNLPATVEQLPAVKNQEQLSQALGRLKDTFNLLVPAQMNFSSPLHKVSLEAVQLDPKIDDKGNGVDFYRPGKSGGFTLHYKAINKLAAASGVQLTNGRIVKREVDKDGRTTYVEYSIQWSVKRVNGSIRQGESTGTYKWEEERRGPNLNMAEQARRFAEQRAESNAKVRAFFEALDMLPRSFNPAEMAKPFLVPCVVEDLTDLIRDDPEAKRMVLAHSLGMTGEVFGPVQQQAPALPPAEIQQAEVVETSRPAQAPVNVQTGEVRMSEADYKAQWFAAPEKERLEQIATLVKAKGYTPKEGSKPPSELPAASQVQYLWFLYSLADKTEQAMPWE